MTNLHFGYWVFGKDMLNVNLQNLKNNGVTDLFLNYYAFTTHGESKVLNWIQEAKNKGINVHIWMQCFYDGSWHNPVNTDLTSRVNEAKKYASMKNVYGVHLDYLRYPGNAYKTTGGADAITNFVKKVRSQIPNTFLSCAVMPEDSCKYYYGQDIEALGKIVDAVMPMQYKGNYNAGSDWLARTSKSFSSKATIWSGLQSYKSDDNPTMLSSSELLSDAKTCINNNAKGAILFRYGLSPNVDFKTINRNGEKLKEISNNNIFKMARDVKAHVESGKTGLPNNLTYDGIKYMWYDIMYIMSYAVNHLTSNCTVPNLSSHSDPWLGDTINEQIKKDDFLKQASKIIDFVKNNNNKMPNYVTTIKSGKKVNSNLYGYCFSKILVYYKDHKNTLPLQCLYSSSNVKKAASTSTDSKYGHATKSGCDNMGQNNGHFCGPHSLQEVFRNLTGIVVKQSTIASWAGTTSSGTDHDGLSSAVAKFNKTYNKNLKVEWKNFSELGWNGIDKIVKSKNQDCVIHNLYRRNGEKGYGHYETVNSVSTNVNVQNSLGDKCSNGCYCGYIEYRSQSTFTYYINGISQKSVMVITNA